RRRGPWGGGGGHDDRGGEPGHGPGVHRRPLRRGRQRARPPRRDPQGRGGRLRWLRHRVLRRSRSPGRARDRPRPRPGHRGSGDARRQHDRRRIHDRHDARAHARHLPAARGGLRHGPALPQHPRDRPRRAGSRTGGLGRAHHHRRGVPAGSEGRPRRRDRPRLRRHGRPLGRDRPGDRRARRRGRHRRREARRGPGGPRPSDEQDRRARLPAPQGLPWRAARLRARGRVSQRPVTTDPSGEPVPGPRILLGPGPSTADPRVLSAMAAPLLGQFDPEFTAIMNEVMALCRFAFQTRNERAFPVSGTGRAGLEAAIVSLVEPGDRVVVGECGRFGLLLIEIAERCGAEVVPVKAEWGRVIEPEAIEAALQGGRTSLVALLLADAVVTLGGSEVAVDRWQVDVAVAGTQKCLSCPSGLAPLTYNERAERVLAARTTKIRSNYLDLAQLARYWSPARFNHHTAPTAMVYGLRAALRALEAEGLERRFARHRLHGDALRAGLDALRLT